MAATTTMTTMTLSALLKFIANAEANAANAANAANTEHKVYIMRDYGINDNRKQRSNARNNGYAKQHMSKGRTANITSRHRYNYQNRPKIR